MPKSTPQRAAPSQPPAAKHSPDVADAQIFARPFVHDDGEAKSLHFTQAELQSRMNKLNPWRLEVDYTRTMMAFLLLKPAPRSIAMIGLGGGSLAKFCFRYLPDCDITVVEINPHVIALKSEFSVPADDKQFRVLEGDGAAFVARSPASFDVLLVDGFDDRGQPAALCSQRFYDACFAALKPGGVLVVNLHQDDPGYAVWAGRIFRSFNGNAVEVAAPEKSNCIVFASSGPLISPRRIELTKISARLAAEARGQLAAEFERVAWSMQDLDASSD
jgi:spermidine synthase